MIEVEYDCGCKYFHSGADKVSMSHACPDHAAEICQGRVNELTL